MPENGDLQKEQQASQDTLSIYANLLGLTERRYPKTIEEFPNTLLLPASMAGDLEQAITETIRDGHERYQYVHTAKDGSIIKDKLMIGTTRSCGKRASFENAIRIYLGKKALLHFHTHPSGDALPSIGDVAIFQGAPRMAFIQAIGSEKDVYFFFQTEKAAQLPFSDFAKRTNAVRSLINSNWDESNEARVAQYAAEHGLAMYKKNPIKLNEVRGAWRSQRGIARSSMSLVKISK